MAEFTTYYDTHYAEQTGFTGPSAGVNYQNIVYDSVLGGGSWQRWASSGSPDSTGSGYTAATGGSVGDWLANSYGFEVG